jgi:hypothetical protein
LRGAADHFSSSHFVGDRSSDRNAVRGRTKPKD